MQTVWRGLVMIALGSLIAAGTVGCDRSELTAAGQAALEPSGGKALQAARIWWWLPPPRG